MKFTRGNFLCLLVSLSALAAGAAASPAETAPALKFDVVPAPFFIREGGELKQMLRVLLENAGAEISGELEANIGTVERRWPLDRIPPGKSERAFYIPEITQPAAAKIKLKVGTKILSAEKTLRPQRKWMIYLFHHSHTDIGYTELQTRIYKKHAEYLDEVIKYCRETDGYPDDARFRWNAETAWSIQNYIRQRPESKVEDLVELIKEGRVEVGAWYLQLSDTFAHEELIRAVYFARELNRKYGITVTGAMNNDVTGFSWASPQILSRSGVRYFATGINETRSRAPLRRPCAFYWESPDGSRILHWNGEHYLFSNYGLRLHEAEEKSVPQVAGYLAGLEERGDYPFDLIAFNISAWVTDNCPPGRKLSDIVRDWNARWAYPRLRLATMGEFFEALEKKYAAAISVHRLGWPDYWTDGVASTAYETGLNRLAHNTLLTAEKLAALAGEVDPEFVYPGAEIGEGYNRSMFYDEHTWGAHNSIDDPDSELARSQWAHKSGFAYEASETSRTLLEKGLGAVAGRIRSPAEFSLAVFNPLSWERTDIVRVFLPEKLAEKKRNFRLHDGRSGDEVVYQSIDDRTILFLARDIPAFGYVVYTVSVNGAPARTETKPGPAVKSLDNSFYRIVVDQASGGIKSLFDKTLRAECVDSSSPFRLNQYIYENPEGGRKAVDNMEKRAVFRRASPTSADLLPGWQGPVASSLIARMTAPGCREIESEIILYEGIKRVDIVNRLRKEDTAIPEAVYFAFPFNVDGGKFVFEIADGMMRPEIEQLPGTTRDWHTVQHWVEASNAERSIVWSSVEAPLIQFGDINTGKWLKTLEIPKSSLFSYAMNNYWMTNFKASQGGLTTFRYAITSRAGGADPVQSGRFGWEVHTPLVAGWIPEESIGTLEAMEASFFQVDQPSVILQALKRAEDGRGLILRLREIAGRDTEVRVKSALWQGRKISAMLTDIAEGDEKPAPASADGIAVPVKAFGIQTVRIVISK